MSFVLTSFIHSTFALSGVKICKVHILYSVKYTVKNGSKVTTQQKNKLIEIVTDDSNLFCGKFSASFSFKDAQKKCEEIAELLNSFTGAKKSWKQWRKTWQDIRTKTKRKNCKMRKYSEGTGGGSSLDTFTGSKVKVLLSISKEILEGNDIPQTEVNFQFSSEVDISVHVDPVLDHIYVVKDGIKTKENKTKENKENSASPVLTPKSNKKRSVAAQRLLKSSNATSVFADISAKDMEIREKYYTKKLELMERQVLALEKIALALNST